MSSRSNKSGLNIVLIVAALSALAGLLLYKLGSIVFGLSYNEITVASQPLGWHGIYHNPLDLPLKAVRTVVFYVAPGHGQTLTRLPNALFGGLAVISFSALVWLWHGTRTAILASLLFATSAWTLHVSRYAGSEIMYLWAVPTLLLTQVLLHRYGEKPAAWYASLAIWGTLLYIPGMVWFIAAQIIVQRKLIAKTFQGIKSTRHTIGTCVMIGLWLPLIVMNLMRPGQLFGWLGFPADFAGPLHALKQFAGVFVHLFLRGPQYPEIWLDKVPILDVFTIITAGLGIYFYAKRYTATRSQTLGALFIVGTILVALDGPVSISALIALLYICAAAGIAYLLQAWLKVFPLNPLARSVGIGLICLAVSLSCLYNLRSYFIAWPHNETTKTIFHYHR